MKQYRAWYTGDNPPLLFEMVYVPNDELYFRMASDHEIKYDFKVPFIDTDWIVEEGIELQDILGKEIFKGDTVMWSKHYVNYEKVSAGKSTIIYDKRKAAFVIDSENLIDDPILSMLNIDIMGLEIIGTIHDKEKK